MRTLNFIDAMFVSRRYQRTRQFMYRFLVVVTGLAFVNAQLISAEMYTAQDIETSVYDGRVSVCANNSVSVNETCVCDVGFALGTTPNECIPCGDGQYKDTTGLSACQCTAGYTGPDGGKCAACVNGTSKELPWQPPARQTGDSGVLSADSVRALWLEVDSGLGLGHWSMTNSVA